MIKPPVVTIGTEQIVVLTRKEFDVLSRKAETWEPELPPPNERGNYPLSALNVVTAQEVIRARRKAGLTQSDLAHLAGIGLETLARIESGTSSTSTRTMQKIQNALQNA